MTVRWTVRAARAGFPKMSKASFWGCAIPKSRSKAEIKNSALRRSDETESSRPCQKILVLRNEDFFIQAAGLVYHPTQVGISSKKAKIRLFAYHHALACISAA